MILTDYEREIYRAIKAAYLAAPYQTQKAVHAFFFGQPAWPQRNPVRYGLLCGIAGAAIAATAVVWGH